MWIVDTLGEVLRSRREKLGMSQAELAAAAGVSLRQIGRYELGQQQPVLAVAFSLAEALGITLNELAGGPLSSRSLQQTVDRHEAELQNTRREVNELTQSITALREEVNSLVDRASNEDGGEAPKSMKRYEQLLGEMQAILLQVCEEVGVAWHPGQHQVEERKRASG